MKIEINTAELLGDETTIREEVIEQISEAFRIEIKKNADRLFQEMFKEALSLSIQEKTRELVEFHLDTEFVETDQYGRKSPPTTVRNRIAEILAKQCVFKKTSYSSDRNAFTTAVLATVEGEMKKFRKEYISLVNKQLVESCMDEATKKLKAACGIS